MDFEVEALNGVYRGSIPFYLKKEREKNKNKNRKWGRKYSKTDNPFYRK